MDGSAAIPRARARERLVPPAPTPPERDLGFFELLWRMPVDALGCWCAAAYRETLAHRRHLGIDFHLVNDPALARELLLDRADNYVRPVGLRRLMRPGVGRGLLLAEGQAWREQRTRLAAAFTPQHVDRLLPHIRGAARTMLEGLAAGRRTNLQQVLEATAIDSFGRAVFSLPLSPRADRIVSLAKAYFGRLGRPQLWDLLARREDDFGFAMAGRRTWSRRWFAEIDAIIAERRARPLPPGAATDALELLFAARDPTTDAALADDAIRDEVASTLAAGFETTSRLLTWSVYLLSRDPDEQRAVRAEARRRPPDSIRTLADLRAWPRLRNVLLETLRLYPSVPFILRVAERPDRVGEADIRAGAVVIVSPWLMHRHRRWWRRPEAFMPERFAEEPERLRDGTFIPFGLGRRTCVGATFATAEASLILAELLARYEIALDDDRPVTPRGIVTTPSVAPWFRLHEAGRR